jgi:DNA-binding XRE family transcriptional regulator
MPFHGLQFKDHDSVFALIKEISGKRIEEQRHQHRVTQRELAQAVDGSERWLREIEGGNPKSRIDDHIMCAHRLGLSTFPVRIPLLFMENHMSVPTELLLDEGLLELEKRCLAIIAEYHGDAMARRESELPDPPPPAAR